MTFIDAITSRLAAWREQPTIHLDRTLLQSTSGKTTAAVISILLLVASVLAVTYLYTLVRYKQHLARLTTDSPQKPPAIPYTIPFLGSAIEFLAPKPGLFWKHLFSYHPRSSGACTLLLGGQKAHILYDQTAVASLFKAKGPTRQRFNVQLLQNVFDLSLVEIEKLYGEREEVEAYEKDGELVTPIRRQEDIWNEFLIKTESVAELTSQFTSCLRSSLDEDVRLKDGKVLETGVFEWLRGHMFKASTLSLLGSRILEEYPELVDDFWVFDRAFLPLFFGLPKFTLKKEWAIMRKVAAGCAKWHDAIYKESKGRPIDPRGPAWEPLWGSRVNRARHEYFRQREMEPRTKAALDIAMLFGLNSNAIPSACWMIMHIIDPKGDATLLPRVMAELETAQNADGSLDIAALIALPLLQSIFQEALRLYTDVLVTRDLPQDLVLPMHDGNTSMLFEKGSTIMAPSYLGHNDSERWGTPEAPCEVFYADRFLKKDAETGKDVFTMNGTNGKLFPFGGGKTICPGRVFAKQEVLGAVAIALLNYDLRNPQYVDNNGQPAASFPSLADGYGGAGVMSANGDVRVEIRRR